MQRSMERKSRSLIAVAAIATVSLLAVGCTSSSESASGDSSSESVGTLRVSNFPVINLAALYGGISDGAFEAESLNVEPTDISGAGATIVSALIGGSIDVAASNLVSVMQANAEGNDVQCFAGLTRKADTGRTLAILAGEKSTVETAADLASAKIGVNALGGGNELIVRNWLASEGVTFSGEFIAVAPPTSAQALASGDVDAAIVDEPFTTIAVTGGARVIEERPHEAIEATPMFDCWATTPKVIAEKGDAIRAFVAGIEATNEKLNTDSAFLLNTLTEDLGVDAAVADEISPPIYDAAISLGDVTPWYDLAVEYDLISADFDPATILVTP